MSFNRTASHIAPLLLRNGRSAFARSVYLQRQVPAVSLVVPCRALSGEPQTSSNEHGNYPPPGFNASQAKKPLNKDSQPDTKSNSPDKSSQASSATPDVNIPANKPTADAPTQAREQQALNELAAEKTAEDKAEEKKLAVKKEAAKKLTLGQKIMKEVHHYWDGTKLLATEARISFKLALKMGGGYELTRREHRQVSCMFLVSLLRLHNDCASTGSQTCYKD